MCQGNYLFAMMFLKVMVQSKISIVNHINLEMFSFFVIFDFFTVKILLDGIGDLNIAITRPDDSYCIFTTKYFQPYNIMKKYVNIVCAVIALHFKQTQYSRGCSINTFVIN